MYTLEKEGALSRDNRKKKKIYLSFIVSYSDVIKTDVLIVFNNELC